MGVKRIVKEPPPAATPDLQRVFLTRFPAGPCDE